MRIDFTKAAQVVHLLCEGVGIRAIERLTQLNRRTVLNILETAGQKCASLLDSKIRGIKTEQVQVDELWAFVGCKQHNSKRSPDEGDQYTFLAIDRASKLIISHLVGKRIKFSANDFMLDLSQRIEGRFQLSSDAFPCYTGRNGAVYRAFGEEIDYGTEIKIYHNSREQKEYRRYSPPEMMATHRTSRIGEPDRKFINISHAERTNLSVRLFNRRQTRLTLGYSKKLANHKHAAAIFVAHFNFCRKHSAHGQSPAQAAGLTDHAWTISELVASPIWP